MYYILNENIALRSWRLIPHAYYSRFLPTARYLSKEEFELLIKCDGITDIDETPLLKAMIAKGFIYKCNKNEKELTDWQKYKHCDNRYFPKLNWMITSKCNYNCLHCFNAIDNSPLKDEWSFEDAIKLLDEAQKCGIHAFTLTGGEPMAHKNFLEIVFEIYKRDMFVEEINTNGFFVNQNLLDYFKKISANPTIKISFDCLDYHDWMRNKEGAEKETIKAIQLCVENGFTVKVQTNINKVNVNSLLRTMHYLDKIGVKETRIIKTTETPRWVKNAPNETLEIEEYFDCVLEFIKEYIKENRKMSINAWQFLSVNPLNKTYCLTPVICNKGDYKDTIPVCISNRGMIAIAANGGVYPCHQTSGIFDSKNIKVDNVKTKNLQEVLQYGNYINEVCYTVGQLRKNNDECSNCEYFKYCLGGCRAVALIHTNDKNGKDPTKCMFFKKGYHEKIKDILFNWNSLSIL